ncbi:peptidylprolyl isomerase [Paraburkholderia sp.]|uniref:peptidylprolyl isomerase n=1 Tax=Paraburkholderia sp. TaxID=1926495 RepID=UPI0025D24797|nr:peptidylprolyl isomerase [Paraburkholderia sp.]
MTKLDDRHKIDSTLIRIVVPTNRWGRFTEKEQSLSSGKSGSKFRRSCMTAIRVICVAAFASVFAVQWPASAYGADTAPARASHGGLPAGAFAVVNGVALSQAQLNAAAQAMAARTGRRIDAGLVAEVKQQLIVREVLRQAAEKENYGKRPEVRQAARAAVVDTETQLYIQNHIRPPRVTEAQVKSAYEAAVASLGPIEYKPRLIAVTSEAAAQRVLSALRSGQDFAAVARQYSVSSTMAVGGAMPWVSFPLPVTEDRTQGLPLPLAQAIASLPAGGVTPQPVQMGNVWLLVKLDAKRLTQVPTFDQARSHTRRQLEDKAFERQAEQLTRSLSSSAVIQR